MDQINEQARQDRGALLQATTALLAGAARVEESLAPDLARIEELILDTALRIAGEIMGHQLRVTDTPGLDAVNRALRLGVAPDVLRVRLNPADAQTLVNPVVRAELGLPESLEISADPSLAPGDSIAEFPDGAIESRLDQALQRTREVLGG